MPMAMDFLSPKIVMTTTQTCIRGATEVCNGIHDDCDGQVDEGVLTTFYQDQDHDGYRQRGGEPTGLLCTSRLR